LSRNKRPTIAEKTTWYLTDVVTKNAPNHHQTEKLQSNAQEKKKKKGGWRESMVGKKRKPKTYSCTEYGDARLQNKQDHKQAELEIK